MDLLNKIKDMNKTEIIDQIKNIDKTKIEELEENVVGMLQSRLRSLEDEFNGWLCEFIDKECDLSDMVDEDSLWNFISNTTTEFNNKSFLGCDDNIKLYDIIQSYKN